MALSLGSTISPPNGQNGRPYRTSRCSYPTRGVSLHLDIVDGRFGRFHLTCDQAEETLMCYPLCCLPLASLVLRSASPKLSFAYTHRLPSKIRLPIEPVPSLVPCTRSPSKRLFPSLSPSLSISQWPRPHTPP